jgi:hypothetical protein
MPRRSSVPQLLVLEDRTVLSVLTVMNNADSGAGSLRAAIAAAQSGDTIVFDPSLAYETITLSSGPLALSSNLTIDGLGAVMLGVSGNHASQLFTLSGSAQVTLENLTITGGVSSQGGAVFIGGTAALTLDNDVLSGNQAVGDANGNALGGAVFDSAGASLTIDNTLFLNNQTNGTNNSFGGAVDNAGTLAIDDATFAGNAALGSTMVSQGGAIGNQYGSTSTIKLSTFSGNTVLGSGTGNAVGGAIANGDGLDTPPSGSIVSCTLSQCTFQNNTSEAGSTQSNSSVGNGGAIEDESFVDLAVLNCLFTGNQANSGGGTFAYGGAIDNSSAVTVTISGSQFISNSAIGSGVGAQALGGALDNFDTMTIANSLFAGNRAVGGPMADGIQTVGQGGGGAIWTVGSGAVLTLSNSVVANNEAIGGSDGSTLAFGRTDAAFGGGVFVGGNISQVGTLNVSGCTITGNQAIGGASAQGPGGVAMGVGIVNLTGSRLNMTDSTVSSNLCQGGQGAPGAAGGVAAGAGIGNGSVDAVAIITNSILSLNESVGGLGGAGANGGEAVGGGIASAFYTLFGRTDASSVIVSNCQIVGNVAQGGPEGSNAVGGDGLGGGIFVGSGTATLKGVLVSGNQAQGGSDSQGNTTGQGLGGGVYVDPSASATEDTQTLIAGNQGSKSNNDVWGTITPGP